jgi:hypothetical protein
MIEEWKNLAWIEDTLIQRQNQVGFFVSIPTRGLVDNNVVGSLLQLRIPGTYGQPIYALEVGQPIDISRNIAVSKALQMNARYLLFIDSDIVFPGDTLEKLLSYRLPVVGAAYRSRGPPYNVVANVDNHQVGPEVLKDPNTDLLKVDNVGMGFTLIDMRVIKSLANKLEWRCFLDHTQQIKQEVARYDNQKAIDQGYKCSICQKLLVAKFFDYRSGKANKDAISEDFYFCKLCKDNQIPVHLSAKTFVKHMSQQQIGIDGFETNLVSVGDVQ